MHQSSGTGSANESRQPSPHLRNAKPGGFGKGRELHIFSPLPILEFRWFFDEESRSHFPNASAGTMGDVSRFASIRQAISYCGLCGDEKSSADKVMRTPLSKQRNKHIQRVLVEAAKLAPRQDHNLALVYEREKQKGNANRATLAVARKMVAYLLAVDRGQRDFVPFADSQSAAA